MTNERTFTLPLGPLNNRYYRHTRRGITYLSEEGKAYKKTVAELLEGMAPLEGPLVVSATTYRARNAGDIDAYQKSLFDAVRNLAYHDDKQIHAMHWYKEIDRKNPRVEVRIWTKEETTCE